MRRPSSFVSRLGGPTWLKTSLTVIAVACIVARLAVPTIKIDMITLALIALAALPWFFSRIESATLPGGWGVKFRDLERAGTRLTGDDPHVSSARDGHPPSFVAIAKNSPRMALAGLLVEIAARVQAIAEKHRIEEEHARRDLKFMVFELEHRGILTRREVEGISEIAIATGDAMEGADIENGVAQWAIDTGPAILDALDRKITGAELGDAADGAACRR